MSSEGILGKEFLLIPFEPHLPNVYWSGLSRTLGTLCVVGSALLSWNTEIIIDIPYFWCPASCSVWFSMLYFWLLNVRLLLYFKMFFVILSVCPGPQPQPQFKLCFQIGIFLLFSMLCFVDCLFVVFCFDVVCFSLTYDLFFSLWYLRYSFPLTLMCRDRCVCPLVSEHSLKYSFQNFFFKLSILWWLMKSVQGDKNIFYIGT